MAKPKGLKIEEVIIALQQLGGEADWHDIREKVTENHGNDQSDYKDDSSYKKSMFQLVQKHCSFYAKNYNEKYPEYFKKIGNNTRYKLINQNVEITTNQITMEEIDNIKNETNLYIIEETHEIKLEAIDINEPPPRMKSYTNRIIRDTLITRRIKEIHKYQCQICFNDGLKLSDEKIYAEAHHIQPLGFPHNGLDVAQNIICVCPNCHVLLDYGAICINESKIKSIEGHEIAIEYINYHNNQIYKKVL